MCMCVSVVSVETTINVSDESCHWGGVEGGGELYASHTPVSTVDCGCACVRVSSRKGTRAIVLASV